MASSSSSTTSISISLLIAAIAIGLLSITTGAFNIYNPRIANDLTNLKQQLNLINDHTNNNFLQQPQRRRESVILSSWLRDTINSLGLNFLNEKQTFGNQLNENNGEEDDTKKMKKGTVIRTATKQYDSTHSVPSSPLYTTRKNTKGQITIHSNGVSGDYNHYRSTALSSTPDRAVSILTTDILEQLKNAGYTKVQIGDLGENIYVDGIDYKFFEIGKRYKFSMKGEEQGKGGTSSSKSSSSEGVVVEITERIEPCGNLCKLAYINDETIPPAQRFKNCKNFLLWLDQKDGLRGWYGKVIGDGGQVKIGDQVSAMAMG